MYQWRGADTPLNREYNAVGDSDLLSVTSIRTLCGTAPALVNWQINNVVNLATGMRQITKIGPRGGVKKVYVKDGEHPGEFVVRMMESRGQQAALDSIRTWLKTTAEEPRDIAAVRGSVVHKMIEMGLPLRVLDDGVIRQHMAAQWAEERRKVKPEVLPDDVNFVQNGMANYWDMRANVPFVLVAREPQLFNLTLGYGGSADAIIWFLGHWVEHSPEDGQYVFVPIPGAAEMMPKLQKAADAGVITLADVEKIGGVLAVGDWKTSAGVYTSHVIQTIAYMAGEFVASDGLIDVRLSKLLEAAMLGLVIHIRPDRWGVDLFEMRPDVLRAFAGSCAYARFLALHGKPDDLFIHSLTGKAEGIVALEVSDDGE
jgi:hypothetical protein